MTLDLFATGAGASRKAESADLGASRIETLTSLVEGVEAFQRLEYGWRRMADAARDQSVFQSYGFALSAARYHVGRGDRVLAAVAESDGRTACILPVAVRRRAGVSIGVFLGDPIAQYGDAVMAAASPPRAAELALKRLAADAGVDVFRFRRVRDDAAMRPVLRGFALETGSLVEAPHADLALETSAEAFLSRIAGQKQKRERARSRRRLAERGAVAFEVFRGGEAIAPLREAFALKRAWLARLGDASPVIDDPRALAMLERLALDAEDGGGLVVGRLSVGGVPAAYEMGLVNGRRFHAYLGAVSDGFSGASPGKVAMAETLDWCLGEGVDLYDLLPPGDDYKRRWTNGATTVRSYVAPMTAIGRLYAGLWLGGVRPRLRATLDSMPAPLRRRLGGAALKAGAA